MLVFPRSEHAKRSPDCGFLQMKPFDELTAIEFFRLEHGRIRNYIVRSVTILFLILKVYNFALSFSPQRKMAHMKIAHFRDEVENTSKNLKVLFDIL